MSKPSKYIHRTDGRIERIVCKTNDEYYKLILDAYYADNSFRLCIDWWHKQNWKYSITDEEGYSLTASYTHRVSSNGMIEWYVGDLVIDVVRKECQEMVDQIVRMRAFW